MIFTNDASSYTYCSAIGGETFALRLGFNGRQPIMACHQGETG